MPERVQSVDLGPKADDASEDRAMQFQRMENFASNFHRSTALSEYLHI